MNSFGRTLSAFAVVGFVSAYSAQASAQSFGDMAAEPPARTIDASEFDLRSTDDTQALYQHIRRAARRVCIDQYGSWSIKGASFQRVSCIREAVERAVAEADLPVLSATQPELSDMELVASR